MSSSRERAKRVGLKAARVLGWIVVSILSLVVLVALAIQLPFVQNAIVQKAVTYLEETLGTTVSLERISLSFPHDIVLDGIYLEDQQEDTLLYAGRLAVDADLFALTSSTIDIEEIAIERLVTRVHRRSDSTFNFDYIIEAFSSPEQPADTTAGGWTFALYGLDFRDFRVSFTDALEENDVQFAMDELTVNMDAFNLEEQHFAVREVVLSGVDAMLTQGKVPAPPPEPAPDTASSEAPLPFQLDLKEVSLERINVQYRQRGLGQEAAVSIASAMLKADDIDLVQQIVRLDEFSLQDAHFSYEQARQDTIPMQRAEGEETPPAIPQRDEKDLSKGWTVTLRKFDVSGTSVRYDDDNVPAAERGLDPNHIALSNIRVHVDDVEYAPQRYAAKIRQFAFDTRDDFYVETLSGVVSATNTEAKVENFVFKTGRSSLEMALRSDYHSLASLPGDYPNAALDFQLHDTRIAWLDIVYLMPALSAQLPVSVPRGASIGLDAAVTGTVKDLSVERLNVSVLADTRLALSGNIRGLPEVSSLRYDIRLSPFATSAKDLRTILPDSLLPAGVSLPEWARLTGEFSGSLEVPKANALLATELGSVRLEGMADLSTEKMERYDFLLAINEFNVGQLLGQDSLGVVDLEAHVDGRGLSMADIDTDIELVVNKAEFRRYMYRDLLVQGHVTNYLFEGDASMNDPNLQFTFEGDVDYGGAEGAAPAYHFNLDVKNIDLHELHFSGRPLAAKFALEVALDDANPENLNGSLAVREVAFYDGDELYKLDSLLFASLKEEGKNELDINSDMLDAEFKGNFDLLSLSAVLRQYVGKYFPLRDTTMEAPEGNQEFTFKIDLKRSELLTEVLVPGLDRLEPGAITGTFNSGKEVLEVDFNINELVYNGMSLSNLRLKVDGNPRELVYSLRAENISAAVATIPELEIEGKMANDSLRARLTVYDADEKEKFMLGGTMESLDEFYRFHFVEDEVLLNYNEWSVPEDNYLQFGSGGFSARNIALTRGDHRMTMRAPVGSDSSLVVELEKLNLENLLSIVLPADSTISGVVDGMITLHGGADGGVDANIAIAQLSFDNRLLGDLQVDVQQPAADRTSLKLSIGGAETEVLVSGDLITEGSSTRLNIDADLEQLALPPLEPLFAGQVSGLEGTVTGSLRISGTTLDPDISGDLTFNEVMATPAFTNSALRIPAETLSFRGSTMTFANFEVLDADGQPFRLNGTISSLTKPPFAFDLTASADGFKVLNTESATEEQFVYGNLWINADARISGTSDHPVVDLSIDLGDESNVTYVIPQGEAGVMERKGVVRFVDRDAASDPFLRDIQRQKEGVTDTLTAFSGVTLTARIELEEEEILNIVIDPVTGDQLSVQGNANLTLDINETGNMNLVGRYELTDGAYSLTFYKLVKREFDIEAGSSLVWSGDPLNAIMDITAVFSIETSPAPLLANQVTGANQDQLDQFKEELPFLVYLNLDDELLTPEISFELDMPPASQNAFGGSVFAKIQDINSRESELNKQVFALLILQRFIADNPFEGGGGTLEGVARSSVSRVLSEELNKMAKNIEGVELTFDVESSEAFSNGQSVDRTQLQLGLSKTLLDDRLVVKLSGNVDIEGGQGNQNAVSDYIGDLALEYKLTEDGRFRISGFYNNDYDMIDGELRETGVGLIYVKDYNSLRELFKPNAETAK